MTDDMPTLQRRRVLRSVGAAAIGASLAGCTGLGALAGDDDGGPEDVVLGPPENQDRREDIDLPYPTYGESLPAVTVGAPIQDRQLSTREFVGERHVVMTFIYTSCQTVCPGLTAALRRVQADSVAEGYAGEVAFLPTTFDPAYDTREVLAEYGESMGVNDEPGNWFFLRPEGPERAREVVDETFGVAFERSAAEGDGDGGSADGGGGEHASDDRMFVHSALILIANADGVVERAYTGGPPTAGTLTENVRTIVDEW